MSKWANFNEGINLNNAVIQPLQDNRSFHAQVEAAMLRLDLLHPVISGNKWFKLYPHLIKVMQGTFQGIVTEGGPFSNHLHATAAAGMLLKIPVAAIIRGEAPTHDDPTVQDLRAMGMELHFMRREDYRSASEKKKWAATHYPSYLHIPEGGFSEESIQGAASIMNTYPLASFSHILGAMGTGTMMAGILRKASALQTVIGIPVLKIANPAENDLDKLMRAQTSLSNFKIFYDYHQQGYAKINPALIQFMNTFYQETSIPLDRVYTAKLMMAYYDLLEKGFFPSNSKVLIIHSGGLQGNRSMKDKLIFH